MTLNPASKIDVGQVNSLNDNNVNTKTPYSDTMIMNTAHQFISLQHIAGPCAAALSPAAVTVDHLITSSDRNVNNELQA